MSMMESDASGLLKSVDLAGTGPVTRARLRRTTVVYTLFFIVGALPALFQSAPGMQAAGLGLWMPGAGFVAVGGWILLAFPLTLLLFAASIVAWFWAGMVLAPVLVWLGSAALAGWLAQRPAEPVSYGVVLACLVALGIFVAHRRRQRRAMGRARLAAREAFLPASLAEVREQVAEIPEASSREMTEDQLASVRYLLDRALQPIEAFDGFTIIDQFQPAALRYQLNHMGFALGIAQGAYAPNFRGYLAEAQRNLISKYLQRRVWDYWVYESCWGHLNFTNFDPAARDNIMLTGWFGMHVGQYMLNSGDRRYAEPGSLTFRLNRRTAYEHDFHSLIDSVEKNFDRSQFCLYPCEPNWVYPICNHYGMASLAVHDALYHSGLVPKHLPRWLQMLDTEFTDASGSIIGLRSEHTGIEFPFPVGEAGYSFFANCFDSDRAQRLWAIARKELEPLIGSDENGEPIFRFPGRGLDAGNYKPGFTATFASLLVGAREFGDPLIAAAALNGLESQCGAARDGGVCRYTFGSNIANATAVLGKLMGTGDFKRSFVEGPTPRTLAGPVLDDVTYPDVLVARAFSHGDDLELVLYRGRQGVDSARLRVSQLEPGRRYRLDGERDELTANARGSAELTVPLTGRTELRLLPVAPAA